MGGMNWRADMDPMESGGYSTFGILLAVGFVIWVLISVAKDDVDTAKVLFFVLIALPILGYILFPLLGFAFKSLASVFYELFSKDTIGAVLGLVFFWGAIKLIGNTLMKEEEKNNNENERK
jgi:uncharacterized membrane protein YagU involved in acid resistance